MKCGNWFLLRIRFSAADATIAVPTKGCSIPASRLLGELQLIKQLSSERLFRLKRKGAAQLGSGRLFLSICPEDHGQAEISLDQLRLQADSFAKGRDRLRAMVDLSAQAKPEIEPRYSQVWLSLDRCAETGLRFFGAAPTQPGDAELHLDFD